MRAVRGRDNASTERRLRAALVQHGIRGWHLHRAELPGRPDFVFPHRRVAIFVDGCFWHGCPTCYRRPRSNRSYWDKKIIRNKTRDVDTDRELSLQGWKTLHLWEHELSE